MKVQGKGMYQMTEASTELAKAGHMWGLCSVTEGPRQRLPQRMRSTFGSLLRQARSNATSEGGAWAAQGRRWPQEKVPNALTGESCR